MALLEEPRGWRSLQEMAQRERDPQRLASIIDQMNRLLDQNERMAAGDELQTISRRSPPKLDVQTWQNQA